MSPKKKSAYTVPKLKDFSATALDKAVDETAGCALKRNPKRSTAKPSGKIFRDRWMARTNGILTQVNDLWLKAAPKEAKRDVGQRVNELKASSRADRRWTLHDRWQNGAISKRARCRKCRRLEIDDASASRLNCPSDARHHPSWHSPSARRGASRHQDDERDCRGVSQSWVFGRGRPGD